MSHIILQQPDGWYAIWSTVVDDFIVEDATPAEIVEYKAERAARQARDSAIEKLIEWEKCDDGEEPYDTRVHPGTYEEAVRWKDHLEEVSDE